MMLDFLEARKSKILFFKKDIRKKKTKQGKVNIPEGLFSKCIKCGEFIFNEENLKKTIRFVLIVIFILI